MRIDKNTTIRLGGRNIVKVKLGDVVIWQKTTEPEPVGPDYFYIESLGDANTISVKNKGDGSTYGVTPTLEYSKDKNTWNTITFDWTSGEHTTELPVKLNTGEKMYFRNDTRKFSGSYNSYISFLSSVSSNVGGDIRTLSNYLDVNSETKPQSYMFKELFYNNKYIVDASNLRLPYTTIEEHCYSSMFKGCTSLTTAPIELPATTLKMYCYSSMFYGCTSLTTIPALPATNLNLGCYFWMFYNCTSLTTAPALPATTLASSCYQSMFNGCNSLTSAPALPATTTEQYCYQSMFNGCTSLTSAPELPATTMKQYCYSSMFYGCTSLTTAPELPATTLEVSCCSSMFNGCTSLTSAPTELPATTLAMYCYSSMFGGCTSLTSAPELPATTLASSCYQSMFNGCNSLTSAPELPATTLASSCYQNMFSGCFKLKSVTVYTKDISASDCTKNWLSGVARSGTFNNMGFAPFENGASGIPTGWTENIPPIQSITANPDTFTIEFNNETVTCNSTLEVTTTAGTLTKTNSATLTVGENTESTTRTLTKTIPYYNSSYDVTIVQSAIQSITANPDTFTIEFNNETVTCNSTLTITTTLGTTFTDTNSATITVGENTGNTIRTITETIPYKGSSYNVTIVQSAIQSITANPDTFTIKSYKDTVKCNSTLTITTTLGTTFTDTNSATITVGENTGDTTRTLTETIPYKGSSYQITIVQTANDVKPTLSWNVVSTGTYPFELNTNGYYESTNKGHDSSYSYATLNYEGFENLVLECINSGESNYDYGIISQPDVQLGESISDDGATGSTNVFHNFKGESSTNPVQLTIPSDEGSHFITIKFRKDSSQAQGNDSLQFKVIEP